VRLGATHNSNSMLLCTKVKSETRHRAMPECPNWVFNGNEKILQNNMLNI
jgi:hypothetical protein